MHAQVKELGQPIQDALKAVSYGGRDIEVRPASTIELFAGASRQGARGFIIAIDLRTGERISQQGQWGGANPFVHSPVDETDEVYTLPEYGVVIKGQTGYPRTFATVYVHPSAMGKMLPAPVEETSDSEQQALYCFCAMKGGTYRAEELRRRRVSPATLESLIERGYLVRNKAGSVQVTTKGKNARDKGRVRF